MSFLKKYREILIYLVVGVLTTIVSWGACFVAKIFLDPNQDLQNFVINTIGWVAGVVFAYPLNRKWVFESTNKNIVKEFFGFASSRLSTWILDILIMWFFVNICPLHNLISTVCMQMNMTLTPETLDSLNYWVAKICISAVLVTILNYIFSKLFIFKKKPKEDNANQDDSIE